MRLRVNRRRRNPKQGNERRFSDRGNFASLPVEKWMEREKHDATQQQPNLSCAGFCDRIGDELFELFLRLVGELFAVEDE